MNKDDLQWEWERFRYDVSLAEKEFVEQNRGKFANYCELERSLRKRLDKIFSERRNLLLMEQLKSRIGRKAFL